MFAVEIIDCQNGYIVLEGNSLAVGQPYHYERKKWICRTEAELGELISRLAFEQRADAQEQRGPDVR